MRKYIYLLISVFCFEATSAQVNENIGTLKDKLDGSFYQTDVDGHVYFQFDEKYNDGTLTFTVFNNLRDDITPVANNLTTGNTGDKVLGVNIYDLDLEGNSNYFFKRYYYLEVVDSKGKILKMRFLFQGNDDEDDGGPLPD